MGEVTELGPYGLISDQTAGISVVSQCFLMSLD